MSTMSGQEKESPPNFSGLFVPSVPASYQLTLHGQRDRRGA
jgi:hypothetical protein